MRVQDIKGKGFTVLEVAIVLAIVGLLLAGGVNLMSASSDTSKYKQAQYEMQEVKEALLSFYNINKYLPCPDTDGDGIENPPTRTGTCTNIRGFLPHVTLGTGGAGDSWGERIKYQVTSDSSNFFTTAATGCGYVRPSVPTANTIRIQDLDTAATRYLGEFAAFSLISTGRNGRQTNSGMTGAFTNDGGCAGVNAREQENCDTDSILRYGNQMSDSQTVTFDDMVIWVGDMQLISELRKSGLCSSSSSGSSTSGSSTSGSSTSGSSTSGSSTSGSSTSGSSTSGSSTSGSSTSGSSTSGSSTSGSSTSGSSTSGSSTSGSSTSSGSNSPVCQNNASDRAKCQQGCSGYPEVNGSCNSYNNSNH